MTDKIDHAAALAFAKAYDEDFICAAYLSLAAEVERLKTSIAETRAHYAEDIFPRTSNSPDAKAAAFARLICDGIVKRAATTGDEK